MIRYDGKTIFTKSIIFSEIDENVYRMMNPVSTESNILESRSRQNHSSNFTPKVTSDSISRQNHSSKVRIPIISDSDTSEDISYEVSENDTVDILNIYTDGSCINNHDTVKNRYMGIGIHFVDGIGIDMKDISAPIVDSNKSNTRAEMHAILKVLKVVNKHVRVSSKVVIHSDSESVINGINLYRHTRKKGNPDLWDKLFMLMEKSIHDIEFEHTPRENEFIKLADSLAKRASEKCRLVSSRNV